jgi:hypothetical protein
LVTGAQCDADNTGSVVASDTRSVAVLYGYENDTGSFEGRCVAG